MSKSIKDMAVRWPDGEVVLKKSGAMIKDWHAPKWILLAIDTTVSHKILCKEFEKILKEIYGEDYEPPSRQT